MLRRFSRLVILTTFVSLRFVPGASWAQNELGSPSAQAS